MIPFEQSRLFANAFLHISNDSKRAVLLDTYSCKKYSIPVAIAEKALKNRLCKDDIDKINSKLVSGIEPSTDDSSFDIYELRFILTNTCNFNCTYCFADHGSYGLKLGYMNENVAFRILNLFSANNIRLRQISFFGGEPLICDKLIAQICDYVIKKWKNSPPCFSIVTNGSLLNDNTVRMIKKYNISCVISIDGPAIVNDMQRITSNGNGTFEIVDKNLKKYKNQLYPFSIEATYTKNHIIKGYTRVDIRQYLSKRYDCSRVIINDVTGENKTINDLKTPPSVILSSVKNLFDSNNESYIFDEYSFFLIRTFINGGYSAHFCDAGTKKCTIDMYGNVYPCHLFLGDERFKLFNINSVEDFNSIKPEKILLSKEHLKCSRCGFKLYCRGCTFDMMKNDEICNINRHTINYFLHNILELFLTDRNKYNNLILECIKYAKETSIL